MVPSWTPIFPPPRSSSDAHTRPLLHDHRLRGVEVGAGEVEHPGSLTGDGHAGDRDVALAVVEQLPGLDVVEVRVDDRRASRSSRLATSLARSMSKPTGLPPSRELERLVRDARAHRQGPVLDDLGVERARSSRCSSSEPQPAARPETTTTAAADRRARRVMTPERSRWHVIDRFMSVRRHGEDSVSCWRAYSVTRISACLADSRSRASTLMIGTCGGQGQGVGDLLQGVAAGRRRTG